MIICSEPGSVGMYALPLQNIREFPKIGDPNIIPCIVGSYYKDPKTRYPEFSETPISRP